MSDSEGAGPAAGRPYLPGYGIAPADAGGGLLPWSWAVERLERSRRYWVATRRPDGSPHLAAVWGVWLDDAFVFSTGGSSRKARNLAADNRCVVAPEYGEESVVVEGTVDRVVDDGRLAAIGRVYARKYGTGFPDPDGNPVFAVRPSVVFGVIESDPDFSGRATRWRFPDPGS